MNTENQKSTTETASSQGGVIRSFSKLEIGKSYLTRGGRKVKITEFDKKELMPYKGEYEDGGSNRWYEDGLSGYRTGSWMDIVHCV